MSYRPLTDSPVPTGHAPTAEQLVSAASIPMPAASCQELLRRGADHAVLTTGPVPGEALPAATRWPRRRCPTTTRLLSRC